MLFCYFDISKLDPACGELAVLEHHTPHIAVIYFPFFDGYPLEPHFTHRNGTTVDIALQWLDARTGKPINGSPIALAYGASATPLPGEVDLEEKCGNWLRSIEMKIARHFYEEKNYQLDEARTEPPATSESS